MRKSDATRVLILGASGMFGNAALRWFGANSKYQATGTVRTATPAWNPAPEAQYEIIPSVDVQNFDSLLDVFAAVQPQVVINCVGIVKQLADSEDPLISIPLNALLPHRLAHLCAICNARLIHISTDCVFSGNKGCYREGDVPDALDLYGKTKLLGEVDGPHAITLRTSIIGHELGGSRSLLEWFLAQNGSVKGYERAWFSGVPTVELARIIDEFVIPNPELRGLYHVSASRINKCELLKLVAQVYEKQIEIQPDSKLEIDRSLDSSRFRTATGYSPANWLDLIRMMRRFH